MLIISLWLTNSQWTPVSYWLALCTLFFYCVSPEYVFPPPKRRRIEQRKWTTAGIGADCKLCIFEKPHWSGSRWASGWGHSLMHGLNLPSAKIRSRERGWRLIDLSIHHQFVFHSDPIADATPEGDDRRSSHESVNLARLRWALK